MANDTVLAEERNSILHIARTTTAALASQLIARALRMPEPYWATITTIVVMQSSLGAAWKVSVKRFAGTVLGAIVGGLLASYFGGNLIAFAVAMVGSGLICLGLHLDRTAYRFAWHHTSHHHAGRSAAIRVDHRRPPLRGSFAGDCDGTCARRRVNGKTIDSCSTRIRNSGTAMTASEACESSGG